MKENSKRPETTLITDFDYELPEDRIALFPEKNRDDAKLLVMKNHQLTETFFKQIADFLPEKSVLLLNDSKVIQARMLFENHHGAKIEILCLEPYEPAEINQNFQCRNTCYWTCFVGNNKRWKTEFLTTSFSWDGHEVTLQVKRIKPVDNTWIIEFSWNQPQVDFSGILQAVGHMPLPPYIHRENIPEDKDRYQTVFAIHEGSVAAPTAGLHFTDNVFKSLEKKGILTDFVTLHVGAGTFKPVSSRTIGEHQMHAENVAVKWANIQFLINHLDDHLITVGTTATRVIESIYWYACKCMLQPSTALYLDIQQWDPYDLAEPLPSVKDALQYLSDRMREQQMDILYGTTSLMIAPPYQFKIVKGLITNFHQPKSTLLLLVSALVGDDWKKAYTYALAHQFRFLSYGDSCLFLPA